MQVKGIVGTEDLSFHFNGVEILSNITFVLEKGKFLGIAGPNGSGQTTLIRLLLGLLRPTGGSITLFGESTDLFKEWRKIGYLPQKTAAFNPHFPATVEEIVALGLLAGKSFPGRVLRSDRRSIDDAIALMDVTSIRNKFLGELPGGQQQRVLIAKALVAVPVAIASALCILKLIDKARLYGDAAIGIVSSPGIAGATIVMVNLVLFLLSFAGARLRRTDRSRHPSGPSAAARTP